MFRDQKRELIFEVTFAQQAYYVTVRIRQTFSQS